MGGFLPPAEASALVRALKKEVGLPVVVHTHSAGGLSTLTCLAAADAGAAAVDSALSPFAGGASQPPTETLVSAMRGTPLDPKLDLGALAELAGYFRGVLDHYRALLDIRSLQTDPLILTHQVPGGMLSNLLSQLKEQDAIGRLSEVLAEVPRVRADLGYPPLVTPTSQIVGIQAVFNVLTGGRYRQITKEVRDYVRGLYGRPPGPLDPGLVARVTADSPAIAGRPADLLPPELERSLQEVRALVPAADTAEALSYALFPAVSPRPTGRVSTTASPPRFSRSPRWAWSPRSEPRGPRRRGPLPSESRGARARGRSKAGPASTPNGGGSMRLTVVLEGKRTRLRLRTTGRPSRSTATRSRSASSPGRRSGWSSRSRARRPWSRNGPEPFAAPPTPVVVDGERWVVEVALESAPSGARAPAAPAAVVARTAPRAEAADDGAGIAVRPADARPGRRAQGARGGSRADGNGPPGPRSDEDAQRGDQPGRRDRPEPAGLRGIQRPRARADAADSPGVISERRDP